MTRPAVGMTREQYRMVQEVSDRTGVTRRQIVTMCIDMFIEEAVREKVEREAQSMADASQLSLEILGA